MASNNGHKPGELLWSGQAENGVLGSIIVDPDALHEVGDVLQPGHFYRETNRLVYRTLRRMDASGVAIDTMTLEEALNRNGNAPPDGWFSYITGLVAEVPSSVNIGSYARIVSDYARRRGMVSVAQQLLQAANDTDTSAEDAMSGGISGIIELQQRHDGGDVLSPPVYIRRFLDNLESPDDTERIKTPLVSWNQMLLGGLAKPHTHLLSARPKMGKSSLALQVAGYAAGALGKRVYMATTEMSDLQFSRRVVAQQTGVPSARMVRRNVSPEEMQRIYEAAGKIEAAGPELDVSAGLTPSKVRSRAMRMAGTMGLDLMIVDHLHEMAPDNPRHQRHLELGEMARSLRETARSLDVPLLLVAQLSRAPEQRRDSRPKLSDLREAGALEEVAYSVTFVYREHYYDETQPEHDAELIVGAHRDGPTGTINLDWDGSLMRFEDRA